MGIEEYILGGLIALGAAVVSYFVISIVIEYLNFDTLKEALANLKNKLVEGNKIDSLYTRLEAKFQIRDDNVVDVDFYEITNGNKVDTKKIKFESINSDLRKSIEEGLKITC